MSKGNLTPPAPTVWSEPKIIAEIAQRTLKKRTQLDWLSLYIIMILSGI
jgi:hypothetical protein